MVRFEGDVIAEMDRSGCVVAPGMRKPAFRRPAEARPRARRGARNSAAPGARNDTDRRRHAVTVNICRSYTKQHLDIPRKKGGHRPLGNHCFITSDVLIGAGTRIRAGSFIGMNATILERAMVGRGVVRAGAVILKDVAEGAAHMVESTSPSHRPAARLRRLLAP
jgi:hypothetical protein